MDLLEILQLVLEALLPVLLTQVQRNTKITQSGVNQLIELKSEWTSEMNYQNQKRQEIADLVQRNETDIKRILKTIEPNGN